MQVRSGARFNNYVREDSNPYKSEIKHIDEFSQEEHNVPLPFKPSFVSHSEPQPPTSHSNANNSSTGNQDAKVE